MSSLARGKWIEAPEGIASRMRKFCLPSQEGSGLKLADCSGLDFVYCLPSQEGSGLKHHICRLIFAIVGLPSQEGSGLKQNGDVEP